MSWTALAAAAALPLALGLAGSRFAGLFAAPEETALHRAVLSVLTGCLALHLLLGALQLAGLPWTRATIGAGLALLFLLAHRLVRRPAERTRFPSDLGWGDATALLTLAAFTLVALTLWTATPDFAYHWGLKGHRFFLARGVDWAWLGRSWNWVVHPDYPNLLPELYAATAVAAGRFDPSSLMLWSSACFALMLGATREAVRPTPPPVRQAAVALVGLVAGMLGMSSLLAGGADWMIALALLAAVPALTREPDPPGAAQIGVAAGFAAVAKVEGVALAGFLILVWLARRRRPRPGELAGLFLPAVLVVLPWWVEIHRHGLARGRAGGFDPDRLCAVLPALAKSLVLPAWHGLSFALLLVPLLWIGRRTRPVAAVVSLQLAFYLWVYLSTPGDARFLVLSSFPRLAFHLVPAVLATAAGWCPRVRGSAGSPSPPR